MTDLEVTQKLSELRGTFVDGKYWNHDPAQENDPSSVREIACDHSYHNHSKFDGDCGCNSFNGSIQCAGFAYYLAYRVFGTYPESGAQKANYNGYTDSNGWVYYSMENAAGISLAPGDIIRKDGHSAIVYTVNRDSSSGRNIVKVAQVYGGVKCKIAWDKFYATTFTTDYEDELTAAGYNLEYIIKAPKNSSGGGGSSTEVEVCFKWNYIGSPSENAYVISYEPGLPYSQKGMPTPTRAGYEFGGWCSDPEGTDIFPANHIVPNYPHSLYAKWIQVATVYFKWNYIGAPAENAYIDTYRCGLPYSQKGMPTPTREGYEFGGWCSDIEGTDIFTEDHIVPNWSHDLYAKWIQVATVYFKWNYTGAPAENAYIDTYRCGLPYSQKGMPIPTREGYEFGGWCSDIEGTDIFTEDHIVPNWSHDLYAKWIRCITVYYIRNRTSEDSTCLKQKTCYPGQPFGEMEGYKPYETEDAYYAFNCWYSTRSGGVVYTADSIVPNISENFLRVYASWRRCSNIHFMRNQYENDETCEEELHNSGASFSSDFKYDDYETSDGYYRFAGWYTEKVGGLPYDELHVPFDKEVYVYAHWVRYTRVAFNEFLYARQPYTRDYPTGLPFGSLGSPHESGYRFDGWFSSLQGGTKYTSQTIVPSRKNLMLYAHWSPIITVYLHDNYSDANPRFIPCYANEPYGDYLDSYHPSREGCEFKGWYTSPDYDDGDLITSSSIIPEDSSLTIHLYAHWTVDVIYNPCGGCMLGRSVYTYDVGDIFGKLPEVCCCEEKKYFDGWYTRPNGYGEKISMITAVPDHSITLYANWRPEL